MKKHNIVIYALVASMFIITFLPINQIIKLVLMGLILAAIVFLGRGTWLFISANKHYNKGELDKSLALYQKAVKAGISSKYEITAGSIAVQMGKTEWAKEVLQDAIKTAPKKEQNLIPSAQTALSMAYWLEGDLDKAIEIGEDVLESGYKDKNIYINLCTYYLEKEDLTNFKKLIKEYRSSNMKSPALTDLNAAAHMLNGEWIKAKNMLRQMMEKKDYQFPDPYVHMAQIHLFYGNFSQAIAELQKGISNCTFTCASIIKKETMEKLIELIKEPEKNAGYIMAINKNPLALINGNIPQPIENAVLSFEKEKIEEEMVAIDKGIEAEEDTGDINTELTDEDEEWIRRHQ